MLKMVVLDLSPGLSSILRSKEWVSMQWWDFKGGRKKRCRCRRKIRRRMKRRIRRRGRKVREDTRYLPEAPG
jgi:hypothetical protein